jgi:hypothetical protein
VRSSLRPAQIDGFADAQVKAAYHAAVAKQNLTINALRLHEPISVRFGTDDDPAAKEAAWR